MLLPHDIAKLRSLQLLLEFIVHSLSLCLLQRLELGLKLLYLIQQIFFLLLSHRPWPLAGQS